MLKQKTLYSLYCLVFLIFLPSHGQSIEWKAENPLKIELKTGADTVKIVEFVSKKDFNNTVSIAEKNSFKVTERPRILLSHAVILEKYDL